MMATAQYNYERKNYDHHNLRLPAGTKIQLQQAAKDKGHKSLNAYILTLLEQDTGLDLVLRGELPTLKK